LKLSILKIIISLAIATSALAQETKKYIGDGAIADFSLEIRETKALLYLAHKPSNEPFVQAKVIIQNPEGRMLATFTALSAPGVYETDIAVDSIIGNELILESVDETDSITIVESRKSAGASQPSALSHKVGADSNLISMAIGALLGALITCGIFGGIFFFRSRKKAVALTFLLASTGFALINPTEVLAHGGHDHSDGGPSTEPADSGGDVVISKKSQFLIGVTSVVATKELVPDVMVSYGHIIPKPPLDATIVAPQAGIIRISPELALGKQVSRGDTLAILDAVSQIRITSPISGRIQELSAITGARVENGAKLFHVTDTSVVWVDAELFAADLIRLPDVTEAFVATEGKKSGSNAVILKIATPISEETRTAKVYLELDNADGALRLGSLATASFSLKRTVPAIAVPISAILSRGGDQVIFTQIGPETFSSRQVRTQPSSQPAKILIVEGLNEGERVVVTGNYQLLQKVK
jgi:biotin carboxyl carrier protein